MKTFNLIYESIICESPFLSPRLPSSVRTIKQTRLRGTVRQFSFREAKFTAKDDIVKVQFIPEDLVDNAIELSFTVNDSFDDKPGKMNTEIISGVLGIVLRDVKKYKWDKIFISPKYGKLDSKRNRNRRESVFYPLLKKYLKDYTYIEENSWYKYFKRN